MFVIIIFGHSRFVNRAVNLFGSNKISPDVISIYLPMGITIHNFQQFPVSIILTDNRTVSFRKAKCRCMSPSLIGIIGLSDNIFLFVVLVALSKIAVDIEMKMVVMYSVLFPFLAFFEFHREERRCIFRTIIIDIQRFDFSVQPHPAFVVINRIYCRRNVFQRRLLATCKHRYNQTS